MPAKHRVKFGLQFSVVGSTWESQLEVWKRAEALGFDSGWSSDHLCAVSAGNPFADSLDGWAIQAAMGVATSRLRIGCMVTGNTYRHPAVLAKMATSVDHISGGRLILGIGAGWSVGDHEPFGIPFYTFKERNERLDEAMEVITRLWRDRKANFQGKHYQLKDAVHEPKPVQKPHPPIMIGGVGNSTLRIVAKWADMWNLVGSPKMAKERTSVLAQHCRDLGRDPNAIEKSVLISAIFADDPARRDAIIQRRRTSLSPARAQHGGRDVNMEEDEAANALLLGSPGQIQEQINRFVEVGVTTFLITPPQPVNFRALERLSTEVMPAFA